MVKWLMRDHELLTLNEAELLAQADVIARQIDAFLIEREQSVLSKLIALGGSMEQESFEYKSRSNCRISLLSYPISRNRESKLLRISIIGSTIITSRSKTQPRDAYVSAKMN